MRLLTQKEIDAAPEWATHYLVTKVDYVVWQSKYLEDLNYSGTCPYYIDCGLHINAQPIPRKEFDISEYEFALYTVSESSKETIGFYCYTCETINFSRDDWIAGAKHFKLTAGDLK